MQKNRVANYISNPLPTIQEALVVQRSQRTLSRFLSSLAFALSQAFFPFDNAKVSTLFEPSMGTSSPCPNPCPTSKVSSHLLSQLPLKSGKSTRKTRHYYPPSTFLIGIQILIVNPIRELTLCTLTYI